MSATNLTNHILIAMPNLVDPIFQQTVTYICAHNDEGAMGIVINRPLDISLGEVFTQMAIDIEDELVANEPVYSGGPVQHDRGFILHESSMQWESSIHVNDDVSLTTSRDILQAIASCEGPEQHLVALGYAGWDAGQLEQEIMDNVWLNGDADLNLLFEIPVENRWQQAAQSLGIDLDSLSADVGHA